MDKKLQIIVSGVVAKIQHQQEKGHKRSEGTKWKRKN